jgi:hypothetical protein
MTLMMLATPAAVSRWPMLGFVDRGARAVRFEQLDVAAGEAGDRERLLDDVGVPVDARGEEADLARAVVVDRGALDHGQDGVAVAVRVLQPAQRYRAAAWREHGATGAGVERAAVAIGGQHLALLVGVSAPRRDVDGGAAGDGHVALERQQALHGEVHGDERRRARGLHVDGRAAQVESIRDAGRQEVLVVGGVAQQEPTDLVDHLRIREEVVDQVRVDAASDEHSDRAVEALGYVARRLDRLPHDLEEVPVLGVHDRGVALADAEERGIELVDAFHDAGAPDVVGCVDERGGEPGRHELGRVEVDEAVLAGLHAAPQRIHVGRAWEAAGHADDRDVGLGQVLGLHAVWRSLLARCRRSVAGCSRRTTRCRHAEPSPGGASHPDRCRSARSVPAWPRPHSCLRPPPRARRRFARSGSGRCR